MSKKTVTLSSGLEVEISPVSDTLTKLAKEAVVREFRAKGEPIDPPTYTVIIAGGGTSVETHDETTISTEEEKAAWTKYKEALARMDREVNQRIMKVWLTGLLVDLPEDETWIETQKWLGVELPENKFDLRFHYITTEILKSPNDLLDVIEKIMAESYAGMIKEEDLTAMMDSFRGQIQGQVTFTAKDKEG